MAVFALLLVQSARCLAVGSAVFRPAPPALRRSPWLAMSGGTGGGSSNLEPSAGTGGSSSSAAALSVLVGCQGLDAEDSLLQALEADGLALLAAAAAALEDRPRAELSLTLCDSDFIRGLNAQWRGKDCATDVLSFPQDDAEMLGDVVLCVDVADRQAAERGHERRDELRVLLVHGLLHLLGYDHETSDVDAAEMSEAEGRLLGRLGWRGEGLVAAAG
mmetsp:Transcript_30397/g.99680  ORF Transcript_30397/g.99680 Transcript_30397/m.99680 type:complete len:218 (+) Transcript_30397:3-656(+)